MTNQHTDDRAVEAVARAICEDLHGAPDDYDDLAWQNQAIKAAQAAISAYRQHLEAEGMVVVPKEATDEMAIAGHNAREYSVRHDPAANYFVGFKASYRAMLKAHEGK